MIRRPPGPPWAPGAGPGPPHPGPAAAGTRRARTSRAGRRRAPALRDRGDRGGHPRAVREQRDQHAGEGDGGQHQQPGRRRPRQGQPGRASPGRGRPSKALVRTGITADASAGCLFAGRETRPPFQRTPPARPRHRACRHRSRRGDHGQPRGAPSSMSLAHRAGVQVPGDQVGQRVQPRLPGRREAGVRRDGEVPPGERGDLGQEGPPELVALQRPVPGRAPHGYRPAAAGERVHARPLGDLGHPVVDLVSAHRRHRSRCRSAGPAPCPSRTSPAPAAAPGRPPRRCRTRPGRRSRAASIW